MSTLYPAPQVPDPDGYVFAPTVARPSATLICWGIALTFLVPPFFVSIYVNSFDSYDGPDPAPLTVGGLVALLGSVCLLRGVHRLASTFDRMGGYRESYYAGPAQPPASLPPAPVWDQPVAGRHAHVAAAPQPYTYPAPPPPQG